MKKLKESMPLSAKNVDFAFHSTFQSGMFTPQNIAFSVTNKIKYITLNVPKKKQQSVLLQKNFLSTFPLDLHEKRIKV